MNDYHPIDILISTSFDQDDQQVLEEGVERIKSWNHNLQTSSKDYIDPSTIYNAVYGISQFAQDFSKNSDIIFFEAPSLFPGPNGTVDVMWKNTSVTGLVNVNSEAKATLYELYNQ